MFMAQKGFTYHLPAYIDVLKNFYGCGDEGERERLSKNDFRNLLDTFGLHAEFYPDTMRKNRKVIEAYLRFYESKAAKKHSEAVTMEKISTARETE